MHVSEAFPRTYSALAEALDALGFRARDAFIVEMLVAELKAWERAEAELEGMEDAEVVAVFQGDGYPLGSLPATTAGRPDACALADILLGRYRDEPGDARFLA